MMTENWLRIDIGVIKRDKPIAYWRNPIDGKIYGPDPVLIWGRGYVCFFPTDKTSPWWIPERYVRHAEKQRWENCEGRCRD